MKKRVAKKVLYAPGEQRYRESTIREACRRLAVRRTPGPTRARVHSQFWETLIYKEIT